MLVPKVTPSHNAPRKRRTALSLDRVVDTAFAIVDAEGMDALSARRLARELGCEAMSLYHHVPSMDALIDHVIGRLLAQCPLPSPSQAKGQDPLRRACMDYLALAQRHPRVFALATGRSGRAPAPEDFIGLCAAAASTMARAIARGVHDATPRPGDLLPSWSQR